ncbi:MAG: IS21 family transposase [Ardenticatenia bacterium]|jgi:transposase|nr:IS21 family transposase [Ardenticatenia bacterium]
MISVEEREKIRRAYFNDKKSLRQIAKELHVARKTVCKAIESAEAETYRLRAPRAAPVLGSYKQRIDDLLNENERLPPKQRYTSHTIYKELRKDGYQGSESTVRSYIGQRRKERRRCKVYLPLEFDPGSDAQVDWGEAIVEMGGQRITVQLFYMRLCYSRKLFMMAFPTQKQEAFFEGHVQAFRHFQGAPRRITYDNLKTAVQKILEGHTRQEQQAFIAFRSHYLFESHFCTPGQGHEKGGVEHGVGFGRRNFMVPIPQVASFAELNRLLLAECLNDDARRVDRQPITIGAAWEVERAALLPLPTRDYPCCVTKPVCLTPYSQVEFETNRYSAPTDKVHPHLVLKAYPFRVDILYLEEILASHVRCYGRDQDIFNPLHYLPLLEQRPGAFQHAKPMRRWRETWPPAYERLLAKLQAEQAHNGSVRELVKILKLHETYPANLIEQAVTQALAYGCIHADGVTLCLRQLMHPEAAVASLDLTGNTRLDSHLEPLDLRRYEQLLVAGR